MRTSSLILIFTLTFCFLQVEGIGPFRFPEKIIVHEGSNSLWKRLLWNYAKLWGLRDNSYDPNRQTSNVVVLKVSNLILVLALQSALVLGYASLSAGGYIGRSLSSNSCSWLSWCGVQKSALLAATLTIEDRSCLEKFSCLERSTVQEVVELGTWIRPIIEVTESFHGYGLDDIDILLGSLEASVKESDLNCKIYKCPFLPDV